ncbi:hypothetical protein L596_015029 [Steinernema carpocapsae]|uniref:Uncharacterized protein n=1 Tax=Steinernema carpocapsae TaxID=34508 RepID=A0A4U5NF01_STECR|nr:hypothetical protein L596_015029 [Steinernema carpocapsae]
MNHIYGSENDSKPFHFTYEPHLRFRKRFKAISLYNDTYDSGNVSKPFHFTYEPHLRFRKRLKAISLFVSTTPTIPETFQSHFTFRINDTYDSGNDSKLFHFSYQRHLRFRKRFKAISLFVSTTATIPESIQSHFTFRINDTYDSGNVSKPFHFTYNHTYDSGNVSKPFHFTYEPHLRFRNRFKAISLFVSTTPTIPETIQSYFTFRINDSYDSGIDSKPFHFSYQRHLRFRNRFKAISLTYEPHLRFRKRFKAISLYL